MNKLKTKILIAILLLLIISAVVLLKIYGFQHLTIIFRRFLHI